MSLFNMTVVCLYELSRLSFILLYPTESMPPDKLDSSNITAFTVVWIADE